MKPKLLLLFVSVSFLSSAYSQQWKIWLAKANEKMMVEDYEAAIEDLDKAIDDCETCPTPHFRKAIALAELKEFDKAGKEIKKGKKYSAESNIHLFYTANLYREMGEKEKALLTIHEYLSFDSASIVAASMYRLRASIRSSQKLYEDAYADNLKAYKIQPKDMHVLKSIIMHELHTNQLDKMNKRVAALSFTDTVSKSFSRYYELGNILFGLKRYKEALQLYERAYSINAFSKSISGALGVTKAHLQRFDEGLADLNRLVAKWPKHSYAWNNIGFIKIQQGLYAEALPAIETAISLNSKLADAYNNRGYIYFKLGGKDNMKKALADYDKAIETGPYYYDPYWKYRNEIVLE